MSYHSLLLLHSHHYLHTHTHTLNHCFSGDMNSWDPMKFDYDSLSFNSYVTGPGAMLPSLSPAADERNKKFVSLYVENIPHTCSKVSQHQPVCCH